MSFAARIRSLASDTAVYGLSSIVGRMINFLLVPFYTHVFAAGEYGVVGLLYAAFQFLNIAYTYGLESSYLKFASGQGGRGLAKTVFSTATISLGGTSLLFSILIALFPGPVAFAIGVGREWDVLIRYAAAILALDALCAVPFAELRLARKAWTFALIRMGNVLVNVGLNVWLIVGLEWGIEAVFVANLVASGLTLLALLPVYSRMFRPKFDRGMWKELLRFGLPFVPSGLGYAVSERVGYFFLQHSRPSYDGLSSTDAVGIFNAVWKLGVFMMLIVQMFRFAWQPFFLQHAEDEDAKPLFGRVFSVLTAGMLLIFLAISFFIDELVNLPLPGGRVLIAPTYQAGLYIVPYALLAYFFQGWYYSFSAGLYLVKQTGYFVHSTFVGSGVAVLAGWLLVPPFGLAGAAGATVLAFAAMALSLYFYAQRAYRIPFDWKRVAAMCVLAGGLFAVWAMIPALQRWYAEMGLLLAFLAGLFLLGVLPRDLLQRLRRPAPVKRPRPDAALDAMPGPGTSAAPDAEMPPR